VLTWESLLTRTPGSGRLLECEVSTEAAKRSQSGLLNLSLHLNKGEFSAWVYQKGQTYYSGYFAKA